MLDAIARAAGDRHPTPCAGPRCAAGDLGVTARLALTGGRRGARSRAASRCCGRCCRCSRRSSEDVAAALAATGLASVEWKLDGARVQVHRSGSEVRIFTRNLNDVTGAAPRGRRAGRGRSRPTSSSSTARRSASRDDERPARFQDTMSRFGRDQIERRARAAARSSSTACTPTASTCSTAPLEERREVLAARRGGPGRPVARDRRSRSRRRVPRRGARRRPRRRDGEGAVVDLRGRSARARRGAR